MRSIPAIAYFLASAGLIACGGGNDNPDAAVVVIPDAPIDAPPPPPDEAVQQFDLTCLGMPDPTTADDPITASGTTQEITMNGPAAKGGVAVDIFKAGTATAVNSVVSDANGDFASGNLVTGGVPFDGFIQGTARNGQGNPDPGYRVTFVFPPTPLRASLANAPVLMVSGQTFALLSIAGAPQQDDVNNGALFVAVTDCANTPIPGASLTVTQGGNNVGEVFDLGALSPQAAGLYFVFNVPAGDTLVNATLNGQAFRAHTVKSFKNENGRTSGATTTTIVRPGP